MAYIRNAQDILETSLHRLLNRIDVEKDAINVRNPIVAGYELFSTVADQLFGKLPDSYDKSYAYIDKQIASYNAADSKHWNIHGAYDKYITQIVPDYIKLCVQDAGLSPKQHLPHLQYLVTPGSYLDPASRSQGDVYAEFGTLVAADEFDSIGLSAIKSLKSMLNADKSCITQLKINDSIVTTKFDSDYKPIEGHTSYFVGNSEKNLKFNSTKRFSVEEATKYIVCKEIGDTLQSYLAAKYIKRNTVSPKNVCMFTNDAILTMRCKLLRLQVIYSILRGLSSNIFYHYPVMIEVTAEYIAMHKNNTINKNTKMQAALNSILKKNKFYKYDGSVVTFTSSSKIAKLLSDCITEIRIQTEKFLALNTTNVSVEEYRRISRICTANTLFVNDVLNPGIKQLFIEYSPGTRLFSSTFDIALSGGGSGGSTDDGALPEYIFNYPDYRIVTTTSEQTDPTSLMLNAIYKNVTTYKSELSETSKLYTTEFIYDAVFMFFSYHCITTWEESIIKELIEEYDTGYLGKMTYTEFKPMIDFLMNKYLPPLGIEEQTFMTNHAPKVDEAHMLEIMASLKMNTNTTTTMQEPKLPTQTRKHIRVGAGGGGKKTRKNRRHGLI